MNTELLEIQPHEIRIIFELEKQSSCSIRLVNKSDHHVAFKVKTTSSSKYCARPNTGVIKPNLICDFTVTMQAQKVAPPDLICNDKFLIQSTIVSNGTTEDHIMCTTFAKEDGKHIEETKLKVILVSPPNSPILSSMNRISRMRSYNTVTESNNDLAQNNSSNAKVDEVYTKVVEARKNKQSINRKHTEELRLSNDVEEIKSKLREFESILKQDNPRTNQNTRTGEAGFQLLFVSVVALVVVSVYLGYLLHG
ncbi:vesicle-associated protein 3-1-like [Bidens hawaiensis]|uniref:vesicle-associated protein 3-1-like n=1 Tax=Bidens hawaiensis TaxID=980011 RepID=UPI0040491895